MDFPKEFTQRDIQVSSALQSISKAVAKTKTKIKNERNRSDYWMAIYVFYGEKEGTYHPGFSLSYSRAISYVRTGESVFASSQSYAYKLALAVGDGIEPEFDEPHGAVGFYRHYHAKSGRYTRTGGHIFF